MSATVLIKPKGLLGKKLTLEHVLTEELSYGIPDEYYRLQEGQTGDYTLVFSKETIGRGFEIHFDGKTTELHLNYPNGRHDIELFYMIVARICKLQGVKTFTYEDETVNVSQIEQCIQRDVDTSVQSLGRNEELFADGETHNLMIFGVMNPLSIGEKEIERFGQDIDRFGEWLNEKQQLDSYYAAPHFYQKQDGSIFGVFSIQAGVVSTVPLVPAKPFGMDRELEVGEWYVLLGNTQDDGQLKQVPYEKFIGYVKNAEYYDAEHVVINLTDEEVDEMVAQYQVSI